VPQIARFVAGFAMQSDIGHGVKPMFGGGIKYAKVWDVEAGQKVVLHIADAVFHPFLLMALADITRHDAKTIELGKGRILRIEYGTSYRARVSTADLRLSSRRLWGVALRYAKACW
jgi:hypothetical protein